VSARYRSAVADALMDVIRDPNQLPVGMRLVREIGPTVTPMPGYILCEFEDEGAGPWLEGCDVTPTMQRDTETGTAVIVDRYVDSVKWTTA